MYIQVLRGVFWRSTAIGWRGGIPPNMRNLTQFRRLTTQHQLRLTARADGPARDSYIV